MYKSKFEDKDEDYWRHADVGVDWDKDCRIRHKQSTRYYSFMGRKERKTGMTQRMRAKQ